MHHHDCVLNRARDILLYPNLSLLVMHYCYSIITTVSVQVVASAIIQERKGYEFAIASVVFTIIGVVIGNYSAAPCMHCTLCCV